MKPKIEFHIITLFPEVFRALDASIIGRAQREGNIALETHDLHTWGLGAYKKVDDTPYGGGVGMVLMVEPLYNAWKSIIGRKKNFHTILLSAKGKTFTQRDAERLSKEKRLLFVCGHYEGVDERFTEHCVDEEFSIGDYVLTGGELPACVMVDSIARLLPGVLGKDESSSEESFSLALNNKKEYPHYTKPAEFRGWKIPEVLRSGHHGEIAKWRKNNLK